MSFSAIFEKCDQLLQARGGRKAPAAVPVSADSIPVEVVQAALRGVSDSTVKWINSGGGLRLWDAQEWQVLWKPKERTWTNPNGPPPATAEREEEE